MNLRKIFDALSVKKQVDLYRELPNIDKRNFFFVLAAKLAPYLLNKTNEHKNSSLRAEFSVNGNKVVFTYPNYSLRVNGRLFKGEGQGMNWLSSVIHEIFAAEASKEFEILRPDGFSRKKERLQFKNATGTLFPNILNSVAYASGEQDLSVKGTGAKKLFLTERQFEDVKNKDAFEKHSNSVCDYYIKRGAKVIDVTESGKSMNYIMYALRNPELDRQAEFIARTEDLADIIVNPDVTDPTYIVVSGEEAIICTAHEGDPPSIKEIKVNMPKIEAKEITRVEKVPLQEEYDNFKEWCKENNKSVNSNSYEEYSEMLDEEGIF